MATREEVNGPGAVKVMADYYAFPLWCADSPTADLMEGCPSKALRDDLESWGQEYTENNLREEWPGHAAWVTRGRELAVRVRSEITSEQVRVFYLVEPEDEDARPEWEEITR